MRKIEENINRESAYRGTNIMIAVFRILLCAHENINHHTLALNNKMSDVLQYLNENIHKKIELDELCSRFHISKYYLCHTFKKTGGMTIFEYILARRISIAKRKLIYTDASLAEISMSTGFSSFSYFSKVFKEFEGVTPKDFRKKGAEKA